MPSLYTELREYFIDKETEIVGSDVFSAQEADDNNLSGDRWSGSATLDDVRGSADPVSVTWDVMVPSEIRDCSL